jgi:hypothetical protein
MTPADTYAFEERAAILEYDAADCYPTREAAERRAAQLEVKRVIAQKPNVNGVRPRAGNSLQIATESKP